MLASRQVRHASRSLSHVFQCIVRQLAIARKRRIFSGMTQNYYDQIIHNVRSNVSFPFLLISYGVVMETFYVSSMLVPREIATVIRF